MQNWNFTDLTKRELFTLAALAGLASRIVPFEIWANIHECGEVVMWPDKLIAQSIKPDVLGPYRTVLLREVL